jgi:hypothetical protein
MLKAVPRRGLLLIAALGLAILATGVRSRIQESALADLGYRSGRDGGLDAFFRARAVAGRMPRASRMDWYVTFDSGGDSSLLELYWYGPVGARWPVHVYRDRGGGVLDVYAQDQWPGLSGARKLGVTEASAWMRLAPVPAAEPQYRQRAP